MLGIGRTDRDGSRGDVLRTEGIQASLLVVWKFWHDAARSQRFLVTATTTGWFLLRWLAVAYAIERSDDRVVARRSGRRVAGDRCGTARRADRSRNWYPGLPQQLCRHSVCVRSPDRQS